jgi:glycosyltransferase involved in cell wall biosynthesis
MGRPILCSDTGGVPTYFAADSVLYVPVGDAGAMRGAVLDSTTESRQRLAANAQRTFLQRDYSNKSMIRYYAKSTRDLFDRISLR